MLLSFFLVETKSFALFDLFTDTESAIGSNDLPPAKFQFIASGQSIKLFTIPHVLRLPGPTQLILKGIRRFTFQSINAFIISLRDSRKW